MSERDIVGPVRQRKHPVLWCAEGMPEQKYGLRWPTGDAQSHQKRALLLWAQAREAHSLEMRAELERLALLYERLATRATRRKPATTLGDLVSDETRPTVSEAEWVSLIQRIGARDSEALQTLYRWTHRLVFAFVVGMTNDVFAAEELTVMLYQEVWVEARAYDPARDTVIAWILNKVRAAALDLSLLTYGAGVRIPGAARAAPEVLEMIASARKLTELSSTDDEPGMEPRATGIWTKLLASDTVRSRLGMLVRLAPGAAYPPHVHAGVEQLYLLQGELWIGDRKLYPGGYNRAEPGTADTRVWSETGCTCILVTSSADMLG